MLAVLFSLFSFLFPIKDSPASSLVTAKHPFHVSSTDVRFAARHELQVTARIFLDDAENALASQYKQRTDLTKPSEHARMDALLRTYLAGNFSVQADGRTIPLKYLGFEVQQEAIQVYVQGTYSKPPKNVGIRCTLLYNLFADQINILHTYVNGVRKSVKLTYPANSIGVTF